VSPDEQQYLRRIEQFTGKRFPLKQYPGAPVRTAPHAKTRFSHAVSHTLHPRNHSRKKAHRQNNERKHAKRTQFVGIAKKKGRAKALEAFSTSSDSQRWSNY
jgi:hypothetical protein